MQDVTDHQLLRQYVEEGREEAFATLVNRRVHLVYSAALRKTGNPAAAEEITQIVFIILARKANRLPQNTILSGWLYQTTRLTAANFLRTEIRRVHREQEACMQSNEPESEVWPQILPLLEDAMGRLGEKDRNALALRFFEGKSFQEIGTAFGASENAAKKRVASALEKLRNYFSRHGVISTTSVIAGAISAHSIQTAPLALAKTATTLALAQGAAAPASTLTLLKGVLKIMAWSKAKTAIVTGGVMLLLTAGTATWTVKEIAAHRSQAWQQKPDSAFVDTMPPQMTIVPALHSRAGNIDWWGGRNGKMVGLGVSSTILVQAAYDASLGRLIFSAPPEGKFDFISNLPGHPAEAFQREIKKQFGLVGKRTLIETNVFVLELRNRAVPGLNPTTDPTDQNSSRSNDTIQCVYVPISKLVEFLENALQVPIIDRTGLTGYFDIFVKWDGSPEGLKNAVLKQLGLELVPGREPIEYLVVEKAN